VFLFKPYSSIPPSEAPQPLPSAPEQTPITSSNINLNLHQPNRSEFKPVKADSVCLKAKLQAFATAISVYFNIKILRTGLVFTFTNLSTFPVAFSGFINERWQA
jgi:hypothetical protein